MQYAVIPAYQVMKRYHSSGVPKYMYGSAEMTLLEEKLISLNLAVCDFLQEIDPP